MVIVKKEGTKMILNKTQIGKRKRIEKKAFELFEKRGYSQGNDLDDWFKAEQLVQMENAENIKLVYEKVKKVRKGFV
ncbi:MAG: DUF2934 domain-containing protein [Candidatus Omnitrophica bacterium]|nr:DUF2934 domain-containing protein [Candidatus Omnitrophota bacterium]